MTVPSIALLLLASGLSSRFEDGDKLMAPLGAVPVLDHIAQLDLETTTTSRIAITNSKTPDRRACLEQRAWHCLDNDSPESGQAHALALGINHIRKHTEADVVLILLADMPFVTRAHLAKLTAALTITTRAIMSSNGAALMPPAIFRRPEFPALESLTGDSGARGIFRALDATMIVDLPRGALMDIDTISDLQNAEASLNG